MRTALCTALIASVLSLTGCFMPSVKDPTLTMHVDTAYTAPERQCLEQSAQQWRDQTSGLANVQYEYDYNPKDVVSVLTHKLDHRVVRWTSETPYVKLLEEMESEPDAPYILLGQVNGKGIKDPFHLPIEMGLVMDRLQDNHMCQLTAIHELGHVFGVPHLPKHGDIMFPSVQANRTACLKADDLTIFAQINGFPGELMKPCEDQPSLEITFELEKDGPPSVFQAQ